MQKYLYILLFSVFAITCGSGSKSKTGEGKGILSVTIDPQRFFLDQIVGDAYTINTLVPPGASPETYEPAPSVMVALGKSDIYFMVGDLGFEDAWSERLAKNNPDVKIVNCSDGIELIEGHDCCQDHAHCEGHAHDHNQGNDHASNNDNMQNQNHAHSHDHADQHDHSHSHGGIDPHVWSSPLLVKAFARNMLEAVVESDPGREDLYRANFDIFSKRIDRTDSLIRNILKDVPSRSFIIYHPSLGYFARDYGLNQLSMEFEGKSPSPSQMKELVDIARKENINTVFIERGFDTKNAEVLADEIGAEVFEIDPLAYDWDKELLRIATILARKTDEKIGLH